MKNFILNMLNLNAPSNEVEVVGVNHHRALHFLGHVFGLGFFTALFAHFGMVICLFLAGVFPVLWELGVDGHLHKIVSGTISKAEVNDLRSDLISWYIGFGMGLIFLM